jgi:membrane protein DedA with SNARE-associated domain/DNA-binding transcriptional ArsR family regulator
MNFLEGLHGAVAIALLCSLLFAEEAGVPLPTPGELVLLAAGLLIAAGGLDPYVFGPMAIFACVLGALVGYTWAAAVGDRGLHSLARRLHREETLTKVTTRVRTAGWRGVAISRLIPGLRIYTTLVAGASRLPLSTFLEGMLPATALWVAVFMALGALVGVPVERFLTNVERLAVQGGLLVLVGVGVYLAARKTPAGHGAGLVRLPRWARIVIAAAIDMGVVGSIITGLLALGRLAGIGFKASWVDAVVAALVVAAFYVVVARRSGGATVGEALVRTSYATGQRLTLRSRRRSGRPDLVLRDGVAVGAADIFRALGDPGRLALVGELLKKPCTVAELAATTRSPDLEVEHQLERLRDARLLVATDDDHAVAYAVRTDLRRPLGRLMEEVVQVPGPASAGSSSEAQTPGGGGEPVPTSSAG